MPECGPFPGNGRTPCPAVVAGTINEGRRQVSESPSEGQHSDDQHNDVQHGEDQLAGEQPSEPKSERPGEWRSDWSGSRFTEPPSRPSGESASRPASDRP